MVAAIEWHEPTRLKDAGAEGYATHTTDDGYMRNMECGCVHSRRCNCTCLHCDKCGYAPTHRDEK